MTAGGKNVAPAVLEDRIRAHSLVSQCMVIGDRQPFVAALVTIDEEALPAWTARRTASRLTRPRPTCATTRTCVAEIQTAIDEANNAVSKAESIRVFRILPGDFTETNGMLTPSLEGEAHRGREGVRRRNRRNLSLIRPPGRAPPARPALQRRTRSTGSAWAVRVALLVLVTVLVAGHDRRTPRR